MYFGNTLAEKKTSVLEVDFNCLLTQMGQGQWTRGKAKRIALYALTSSILLI